MKKPNEFIEVFMSLVKIFLAVLIINNLIWGFVVFGMIYGGDANISQEQDGINNKQEMVNG